MLKIEYVNLADIKPNEYNPKLMTEKEAKDLEKSIVEFGIVDPLIVNGAENRRNILIGGHQRYNIYKKLNYEKAPVVYVDIADLEKEKELCVRLSKNTGQWDFDLLAGMDFDFLKNIGFESDYLDKIFQLEEDEFDAQKEYDAIKESTTKNGDLFQIGEHRLICGDSAKEEDIERLMGGEKSRLIFTDPPYNVGYSYDWRSDMHKGKVAHNFFSDKKTDQEYQQFITDVFKNGIEFTTEDANFYCWYASKHHSIVETGLKNAEWKISQQVIWMKNYPVLSCGQDYHRTFEPCLHGWKKNAKGKHFFSKIGNLRDIVNWEDFQGLFDLWFEKRDLLSEYKHPTQKPIKLAERAIKKSSEVNDIVLDFFGGSGSTLMACEQLKRKAYLVEIDPIYCDVIINRWEKFTNQKAIKI